MNITHEQAQKFIQFRADHALSFEDSQRLNSHLKDCAACAEYALILGKLEKTLHATMQKHWNVNPLPLHLNIILNGKTKSKIQDNPILTTRRLLIGIASMLFVFTAWQFSASANHSTGPAFLGVSPIPTPSFIMTGTQGILNECQNIEYAVQKNDTLESIATQFFTSEEALAELNNLSSDDVDELTTLRVPVCDLTPTSTTHPPTFTTTPIPDLTAYTPG